MATQSIHGDVDRNSIAQQSSAKSSRYRGQHSCLGIVTSLLISLTTTSVLIASEPSISVQGADRMAPLVKKLAERFTAANPEIKIGVTSSDPAAAIFLLSNAKIQVAMLDRPLRDEEAARLRRSQKTEPVSIPIAMDAVVMMVHPSNPLDSLTLKQVAEIWSYKVKQWPDLGVPFADKDIKRIGLQPDSGAIDIIVQRTMQSRGFAKSESTKFTSTDVANEVIHNPHAIGYGAMGDHLTAKVLPLRVDESSTPIAPSTDSIQSSQYPLAQYLYLVYPTQLQGDPGKFITFILSPEGQQEISSAKLGPLPLPFKKDEK